MITQITPFTTPMPSRKEPVFFSGRMDITLSELPGRFDQANVQANEVNALAVAASESASDAASSADLAATKASEAAASADSAAAISGATKWISGTTYAQGDVVWSPATWLSYRRKIAGAGTTDPSLDTTNWASITQATPVGTISAWMGGYFTDGSNAGFTSVLGNTVAEANALLNASGWYVCDGAGLNLSGSPIFNGTGRYLPNLTDSRFIMGGTAAGGIGGDNAMSHTHTGPSHTHTITHTHTINHDHVAYTSGATTLTQAMTPAHTHTVSGKDSDNSIHGYIGYGGRSDWTTRSTTTSSIGSSGSHTHSNNMPSYTGTSGASSAGSTGAGGTGNTGAASQTENRPQFLSCLYIMKVQ